MPKKISVLAFACCLLFFSCTTLDQSMRIGNPFKMHMYPLKKIPLMPASSFTELPISRNWNISVKKKSVESFYKVSLQADNKEIFISVFDKNDSNISTIHFEDEKITDLTWSESWDLTPEDSVALFQWCFYDINRVAKMLSSINLRLSIENIPEEETEVRRIYNKSNCIIKIEKSRKRIKYRNYEKKISIFLYEI